MGFGSSGGGFSPSPNNVPGSTQTGTDQTDSHQFTGSVQITGSLLLNGSSITPGGGGGGTSPGGLNTYVQYNNGGNFAGSANFTFDGSNINLSNDTDAFAVIGRAHIGSGSGPSMSDKAMFAHLDQANSTNYALIQRANGQTEINAPSGYTVTQRIGSQIKATLGSNGFFGAGGNFIPQAAIHASSSTGGTSKPVFKADHADNANILVVTGSGRVGIGTDAPTSVLHVSSSATTDLFKVEHTSHADNPIFVVTGSGRVGIGTATPSAVFDVDPDNPAGSNSIRFKGSTQATLFNYSAGEHIYLRGGKTTSTIFIGDVRTTDGSSNQKTIIGNAASTSAKLHVSSSDTPTVMTVTSNNGSILTALENQRVGVGTDAPTAVLHVSSSASDPLLRVDHSTQAGAEPILFVSGSGLVGIGTDTPRTDSGDTNRLHIMGESGADQGQDPVLNSCLTLENNNHVGLQFMFPQGFAGQLTWGTNVNNRKATHYYASDNNRWTWEGRHDGGPVGYGDSRVMTLLAGGDSINIGQINSGHMITSKASLHISSSTGGTDEGGPVLLRVDHADQPGGAPSLFVTGSGRVGIGTSSPGATLEVSGTFLMPGDKPIQLRDSTANINSPFAGIMQLSASLTEITNDVMLTSPNVPGTAGASGQPGMIAWDADYFYVCVGVNSWKRVAIAAW